ncbi:toll-like receptor 13 [Ambystoma mexicanum]|uniref:toll-like receptor 13 n=1 Tax=Ambystoma mexicanum TaxID=8296 RepID=UPI0037E95FEA
MAQGPLCVALGCAVIACCGCTIATGAATSKCDIYEWEQLGPPGVLGPACFGFPLEGFRLMSTCTQVRAWKLDLREVPRGVDTLCLDLVLETVPPHSFSGYQNLTSLFLRGHFFVSERAFYGAGNLRHLGMHGTHVGITPSIFLDQQVFEGLEKLTRLDLINVLICTGFQQSLFKPLQEVRAMSFSQNLCPHLSALTSMLQSLPSLEALEVRRNGVIAARAMDCLPAGNMSGQLPAVSTAALFPRLSTLDVSSNELRKVEENSFCNFPHLTVFRADATMLKVTELLASGIQSIEYLSLNAMLSLGNLLEDVCKVASRLKVSHLTLTTNLIASLPTEPFQGCSNLLSLDVSNNLLWYFTHDIAMELINLRSLVLSSNRIKTLDICPLVASPHILLNLTHLDLSENRITGIASGHLSCLANLVTLDLSRNHLVSLEMGTFAGLDKLQSLHLDFNKLFILENFYFDHLDNLRVIGLGGNLLKSDNSSLKGRSKLQRVSLSFEGHTRIEIAQEELTSLTLEGPNIVIEYTQNQSSLNALYIRSPEIYIRFCDRRPFQFVKQLHLLGNHMFRLLPLIYADSLALQYFTRVEHLYYSSSAVMPFYKAASPLNGSLPHLRYLRLLHLKNLQVDLEKGFLTADKLFRNLTGLRTLILEDSGIEDFTATMFADLVSLELLIVKSQPVKTLQDGLLDHTEMLRYVYLHGVTLDCFCEHVWIGDWLTLHPQVRVPKLGIQVCSLEVQKLNYLNFLEKDCIFQTGYIVFLGTFFFHASFLLTALLYHRVRWYFLYLFYMLRTWWNYRGRQHGHKQYEFDLFVSYSTYDEPWVVGELLPNLEEKGPPFFKVCLHGRDFEVGKDIMDNIMDSIYRSRWTVCLISRHYLRSHWCSLEVRMATYRLLAERKDLLVMVFLEKVSMKHLSRYHQLAKLVKTKTYLEWEQDVSQQPLFWARLRQAIGEDGEEPRDVIVN